MDSMFIIKSGELRYTKNGGSSGRSMSEADFLAKTGMSKIPIKTATKFANRATAEKTLAGLRNWTKSNVTGLLNNNNKRDDYEECLSVAREQAAIWEDARVVEIQLTEI